MCPHTTTYMCPPTKTSTLQILARRVNTALGRERIVYIAFNKSVAAEAQAKMPPNVEVRTTDSISYNWVKLNYPKLMNKNDAKCTIYGNEQIAEHISAPHPAALSNKYTRQFINSRLALIRKSEQSTSIYTYMYILLLCIYLYLYI